MSAETITTVISALGIVLTLGSSMLAGFAWCIRRCDRVEQTLGARIDAVAADTTELKIAMARLEGPQRHLIVAAR